jgi:glutathione S-transferase
MSKIDFYTNPMSRGQIARWALHEAGADYEQHLLDYETTMVGEEYRAINPMAKVPAIVHEGKVVTECSAICAYLADAFPSAELAPRAGEHADYYRWFFFAAGPVEAAVTNNAVGFTPTAERQRMFGYGSYDRTMDVLDGLLSGRNYVCGERFTAADIYVGSQVIWGTQFGTMPARDSFTAYAQRLSARPAYQAAKAIDADLIAAAQAAMPG